MCVRASSICLSVCLLITEQNGFDSLAAGTTTSMVWVVSLCAPQMLTLLFCGVHITLSHETQLQNLFSSNVPEDKSGRMVGWRARVDEHKLL